MTPIFRLFLSMRQLVMYDDFGNVGTVVTKSIVSLGLIAGMGTSIAKPLPDGTILTLESGIVSNYCGNDSCWWSVPAPAFDVWTSILPGTDGGFIIGKNQLSGSQETGPSLSNITPGELTDTQIYFGNYGTFSTAPMTGSNGEVVLNDASLNYFDDTSCRDIECKGKTHVGTWNWAWNGYAVPLGMLSPELCNYQYNCSINWIVNPDMTYILTFDSIVPVGDPSGFGGVQNSFTLAGRIILPGPPPLRNNYLPAGTLLTIEPGVGADFCITGSCFTMNIAPGIHVSTNIAPGTDGGIIIGKTQASGGQGLAPSQTNDTSGEMTDAWNFFANFGTFYTPNGATDNFFSESSCSGASCIGNTRLGSLNIAWMGTDIPMGSVNGCNSFACLPDQLAGIFIREWTVNPDGTYTLQYGSVVPDGDPSNFGNVGFYLLLRGQIILPTRGNQPPVTEPVTVRTPYEQPVNWQSVVSDVDKDTLICQVLDQPVNGSTTMSTDCSSGTYTPNAGFSGIDCSTVQVIDPYQATDTASICVIVEAPMPTPTPILRKDNNLLTRITLAGSRQEQVVNESLKITYTGHIVAADDRTIKVCANTLLNYEAVSTAGIARCRIGGRHVAPSGSINIKTRRERLVCTNRPNGGDTDRYRIKPVKD